LSARFNLLCFADVIIIDRGEKMTMNINKVVVLEPDYLLEKIGSEITVYHPSLTTSLYLNETGALIWELCDGKRSISDIIDILIELYPESRDQIYHGVIDIINSLVENNIAALREL
jgi:hypothetical protein